MSSTDTKSDVAIDAINTASAKWAIFGWFAGLIYALWISKTGLPSGVVGVGFVYAAILIVVGMFAASIIIGGGVALLLAGIARVVTGRSNGLPAIFILGNIIIPVLCFLAATAAVYQIARLDPLGTATKAEAGVVTSAPLQLTFKCDAPAPAIEFTLGQNDRLDDSQKAQLCGCLASSLGADDVAVMTGATKTNDQSVINRVTQNFGAAMHKCGVKF